MTRMQARLPLPNFRIHSCNKLYIQTVNKSNFKINYYYLLDTGKSLHMKIGIFRQLKPAGNFNSCVLFLFYNTVEP